MKHNPLTLGRSWKIIIISNALIALVSSVIFLESEMQLRFASRWDVVVMIESILYIVFQSLNTGILHQAYWRVPHQFWSREAESNSLLGSCYQEANFWGIKLRLVIHHVAFGLSAGCVFMKFYYVYTCRV